MTGEELVKMWAEESNAANDIIVDILESYMDFCDLCMQGSLPLSPIYRLAEMRTKKWQPILETAKKAKEKANKK